MKKGAANYAKNLIKPNYELSQYKKQLLDHN